MIILLTLEAMLARSRVQEKQVMEIRTRNQHAASKGWDAQRRVDTTDLSIDESLRLVQRVLNT